MIACSKADVAGLEQIGINEFGDSEGLFFRMSTAENMLRAASIHADDCDSPRLLKWPITADLMPEIKGCIHP